MQREGVFPEMKLHGHDEKPSERRIREKSEAIRRARKLARKKLQREGLLPMKPRVAPGSMGRKARGVPLASDTGQASVLHLRRLAGLEGRLIRLAEGHGIGSALASICRIRSSRSGLLRSFLNS